MRWMLAGAVLVVATASCSSNGGQTPPPSVPVAPAPTSVPVATSAVTTTVTPSLDDLIYRAYRGPVMEAEEKCPWGEDPYRCYIVPLPDSHVTDGKALWTRVLLRAPVRVGEPEGILYVDLGDTPGYDDTAGLKPWLDARGTLFDRWYVFTVLPLGLNPGTEGGLGLTEGVQYPICGDFFGAASAAVLWSSKEDFSVDTDAAIETAEFWSEAVVECGGYDYGHTGPGRHAWVLESVRITLLGGQLPITIAASTGGSAAAAAFVGLYPESVRRVILTYPDTDWGTAGRSDLVAHAEAGWDGGRTEGDAGFEQWCSERESCAPFLAEIPDGELELGEDGYVREWATVTLLKRYPERNVSAGVLSLMLANPSSWEELEHLLVEVPAAWPVGGYPPREDDLDGDGYDRFGRKVPLVPQYDPENHRSDGLERMLRTLVTPGPSDSDFGAEERLVADYGYRCGGGDTPEIWRRGLPSTEGSPLGYLLGLWLYLPSPGSADMAARSDGSTGGSWVAARDMCNVMMRPREQLAAAEWEWGEDVAMLAVVPLARADITDPLSDKWQDIATRDRTAVVVIEDRTSDPWGEAPSSCVDSWVRRFIEVDPNLWSGEDTAGCRIP